MAAVAEKKTEVQGTHLLVRKYTGQYPTNTIAWMESLFQVSSKIIQIKHEKIQYDGLTDNTDDILLVILEDQFFLLNEKTSTQIVTYHVGGKGISIIDCIYVKNEGVFLAILSNSTIVTIPKNATNNSEYVISDWPIQPFKLYQLQNGTIVLICEGGWLCKVRFENGLIAQIPSITSSSQNNVSIISSCSLGRMIGILYKQSSESSGKRKNKAATPGSHSFVTMIDTANITDKGWENLQSDELGNVSIPLGSVEGTYLLTSHFPNNAVSVIFPDSSSSYRWIKLSPLGETLLSVELNVSPIYSLGTANTLSIICSNSFASWNIHYGVQYSQKSTLNSIFSSFNSAFLPLFHVSTDSTIAVYFGNREDTGDSSTTYCLQRLLLRVDESPAFQLINSDLFEGKHSPHTSLGSLIGSLKKRPLESDFQPPQTGRTRRKSSATEDGILNRLDESKRNLLLRLISEDICVDLTLQDACESFLRCGDSVAALTKVDAVLKIWTESDWKVFDVLVSLKIVGLNSYPALFTFLLEAAKTSFDLRYPLLVSLAKYSIDLSESQAIKLISLVAYQESSESEPKEVKRKRKSSSKDNATVTPTSSLQSLERLTTLLDALLYRRHGFNSSVLSEATCKLSLPLVAILVRIFANMLHGVCNTEQPWRLPITTLNSSTTPHTPFMDYNDQALGNIITWLESLLESHYTSILFALKSSPTSDLTDALLCLMKVIKDLPSSMNLTESTLGVALHYQRLIKYQSKLSPSQQLQVKKEQQFHEIIGNENYQLEVVRFF